MIRPSLFRLHEIDPRHVAEDLEDLAGPQLLRLVDQIEGRLGLPRLSEMKPMSCRKLYSDLRDPGGGVLAVVGHVLAVDHVRDAPDRRCRRATAACRPADRSGRE